MLGTENSVYIPSNSCGEKFIIHVQLSTSKERVFENFIIFPSQKAERNSERLLLLLTDVDVLHASFNVLKQNVVINISAACLCSKKPSKTSSNSIHLSFVPVSFRT